MEATPKKKSRSRRYRRRRRQWLKLAAATALSLPIVGYAGYQYWHQRQRLIVPGARDDIAYSGRYLGCAVSGSTPSNWRYSTQYAQRFRCERTGAVHKIRWWNKFDDRPGYHTGDGGIIQLELRPDDGNGQPATTVLARSQPIRAPLNVGPFPLITIEPSATIKKDFLYHIVYSQLAPERGTISVNECLTWVPDTPIAPFFDEHLASLGPDGSGWRVRPGHHPVFELHYTDGIIKGQGYILGYGPDRRPIGGASVVRQNLRTDDGDIHIAAVYVRLYRAQESGRNLSLRLERGDGTVIEALTILEADVTFDPDHDSKQSKAAGRAIRWLKRRFSQPHFFAVGELIRVQLSAPEGAHYFIQPVQDGRASGWGFAEDKLSHGSVRAEYSQDGGDTWRGVPLFDRDDRPDLDFPILLELA